MIEAPFGMSAQKVCTLTY